MMTIEEMIRIKEEKGLTIAQISEKSGVPLSTLSKIFAGTTGSPRRATLEAVERVLKDPVFLDQGKAHFYKIHNAEDDGFHYVCDRFPGYYSAPDLHSRIDPIPGSTVEKENTAKYTIDDYFAFPQQEHVRTELIDGVFFTSSSPSFIHQELVMLLSYRLHDYVRKNHGQCRVLPAPIDVQFESDRYTVVQPDIVVVCDKYKIKRHIIGAPDLVIEIISHSTGSRDHGIKMAKYLSSGVREYWIIDPDRKKVVVYDFREDWDVFIYGFDSRIPVLIWDGLCEIDFAEIYEEIRYLYETEEEIPDLTEDKNTEADSHE